MFPISPKKRWNENNGWNYTYYMLWFLNKKESIYGHSHRVGIIAKRLEAPKTGAFIFLSH